jgi:PAS domain S-box-containing protein
MKIAAKLKLSAMAPVIMALVIGSTLLLSNKAMEKAREEGNSARHVMERINELNNLARHYMLYHEDRARLQFFMEHESITKLLAAIKFEDSDKQRILDTICRNNESMKEAFLKLISNYERPGSAKDAALIEEAEERLAGRILVKSSDVLSDVLHIKRLINDEIASTQRRINALVFFLVMCATPPFTIVLMRTMGSITASLTALRRGTEVIASGDLTHRIGLSAHDEIGELSRAFDLMAEQLRDTTVSRDELSKEVEERKRAEEAVREQREWLRVTLASIGDAVIATDAEARVTFINPVAAQLTGWPEEEATGQTIEQVFRIINEQTRKPAEDVVGRVLRDGRVAALANHTALLSRNGREIPIEDSAAPIMDKAGGVSGVVLVFHDVTEQRRAQERIESIARFPDENPNPVLRVSDEGELLYANRNSTILLRHLGWKTGTALPEQWRQHALQTLESGFWKEMEVECAEVIYSLKLVPVSDLRYLNIYGNDITERKKAENALRKAHDELEWRVGERTAALSATVTRLELMNQELQEFAFVASHDLQEPLRKIQTFCDLARKRCEPPLDSTAQGYLERVLNSATRMRQLLDDLLQFSRVATRPEPFKEIDLGEIARESADIFESNIRKAGALVEIEDLPVIEADEIQMLRLFQNLIGNALKFCALEPPRIKVYGRQDKRGACEIFVKDNGIGFDQQFADRIFKPFQRLHNSREYEGTGMGLAICRKIAERHGGGIRAESEPGKGSTFIVTLPVKQERWEGI